ncbi:MAG: TonB-dependent receptor, partial [Phascolarctobacterium sp.]|nr:TonB-dependent receptor [Phascolarctobacterium sp.]
GAEYKVNDSLKVFANAYNLTDTRYQEVGGFVSGTGAACYPMPSRSFIIGAEYTF